MTEGTIAVSKVVAGSLWVIAGVLLVTAWLVALTTGKWDLGVMFASASGPVAAAACVFQLRCHVVRLARLIRTIREVEQRRDLTSV